MPVTSWGPAENVNRGASQQYTTIPAGESDSLQIQWTESYSPGYIRSIASGLSLMGSKTRMSEGSATESQTNISASKKVGDMEMDSTM